MKGECQMSLEILEAKEAIREVIDGFANLECNVPAQMVYFRTIKMASRSLPWMAIRLWTCITAGRPS